MFQMDLALGALMATPRLQVEDGNLRQSKRTRADFETEEEYSDYMLQVMRQ